MLLAASVAWAAPDVKLDLIKVRPGDSLSSVSQKYLKDPARWEEILKYNKLPTLDPTVALPAMTLKVPAELIKARLQAATLTETVRKVFAREAGEPAWKKVQKGHVFYHGDTLRTRKRSSARLEFPEGRTLRVEPESMVVLKASEKAGRGLFLNRGAVRATMVRVETKSARIIPRGDDTEYTVRVDKDLSTEVKVLRGEVEVEDGKGRKKVLVPEIPVKIPEPLK